MLNTDTMEAIAKATARRNTAGRPNFATQQAGKSCAHCIAGMVVGLIDTVVMIEPRLSEHPEGDARDGGPDGSPRDRRGDLRDRHGPE